VKRDVFPDSATDPFAGETPDLRVPIAPFFLIFTDLDGTLLDHNSYGWEDALPALELCRSRGVPVILASSKTRSEIDVLRRRLALSAPFISENGGGVFFPAETFEGPPAGASLAQEPTLGLEGSQALSVSRDTHLWQWSLGVPYPRLIVALREIREELGWNIKGFSDMSTKEISRLTGLDEDGSRLAAMREYDEPFIIEGQKPVDIKPLLMIARQRGLTVTSGGRFHHLQGKNDKGRAMAKVIGLYGQDHKDILSIALGDSPNDFGMLERADFPILVRSLRSFPDLKKRIPIIKTTSEMGPKGWNSAVLHMLGESEEKADA